MIDAGVKAPDFIAPAVVGAEAAEIALFDLVEAHDAVALCFAPATFVPTCTAAFAAVRDAGWHGRDDLAVVALTGDSLYAAFAYADRFALPFPVVADFHGGVAESYDLLADSWEGHSDIPRHATVVIDGEWTVRFTAATKDALDRADPAPVERATETLREIGIDVERPRVEYDGEWAR
ncbi:redoxin domain-containing protein [Halorubrum sp. GN11_10-6_MGM]|uniref:redoxin domain-containing protein n=1 Tax=Halorubrum sp. GN11_10-6_MGM TaxID=2518112 RepID=UPI0010F6FA01|nr:redoxin domain-containing protein [Halorubrum sp. GN11_10-6_MGM]TKX75387.1 redoxin domain-containing protein [Halorubrum sp. GN11_10-6_MGM]